MAFPVWIDGLIAYTLQITILASGGPTGYSQPFALAAIIHADPDYGVILIRTELEVSQFRVSRGVFVFRS